MTSNTKNKTYKSNAKINIGLNVIAKRKDGFHNIESIFYPININDTFHIKKSDKSEFIYTSKTIKLPADFSHNNLCEKAYKLLKKKL